MSSFLGGGGGGSSGGGRTILTANATYYYSTTGSDITGDGSSGNPWATPQHAANVIGAFDIANFTVTVNGAAGSYAGVNHPAYYSSGGFVRFTGADDLGSTIWTIQSNNVVSFQGNTSANIIHDRMKWDGTNSSGALIRVGVVANVAIGNQDGGTMIFFQPDQEEIFRADAPGAILAIYDNVTVAGGNPLSYVSALDGGLVYLGGVATTLTGTPAWASAGIIAQDGGVVAWFDNGGGPPTFTGAATGKRFIASSGTIDFGGIAGLNFIPGDTVGFTVGEGVYLHDTGPNSISGQVYGLPFQNSMATRTTKTANYAIQQTETGEQFDNIGASGEVDLTLPVAIAGLKFGFCCAVGQTLKVIAGDGSTKIAIGTSNSAAGGNISANAAFAYVEIEAISTTQWVTTSQPTGTWTVT